MTAALSAMVTDYLKVRRSLGFALDNPERVLVKFVDYLRDRGIEEVTVEDAVAFATAPPCGSARSQALRLSAIRGFTRWARTLDPSIQVPPARLLPARVTRAAPYIYTPSQITALLGAADQLRPQIRASTHHALIALMAATGIRTGEAIGLDVADFDARTGTLTVTGKYGKTRMLPLHPSVTAALTAYLRQREVLLPAASCPALLVSARGRRLLPGAAQHTFRDLTRQAGLTAVTPACRPRLHDLRHTFAVSTMLDAYRCGDDPAVTLPVLSTWLGHARPSDTYWYLSGTAELLDAATARLEDHATIRGEAS